MIEISNDLRVEGRYTFWNTAKFTVRDDVLAELKTIGYEKYAPEARTPIAALKTALEEGFHTRTTRIEKLTDKRAYEVIEIHRGEQANTYTQKYRFSIDDQNRVDVVPFDWTVADTIVKLFNQHRGLITANAVTQSLLGILKSLGGTRVRDDGGTYWIPPVAVDEWRRVGDAIGRCRVKGHKSNTVYAVKHVMDADSLRAVRDGIITEIEQACEQLHDEVLNNTELGERALENRKALAAEYRQKVEMYEALLKEKLPALHQAVDKANQAACNATLLIASGQAQAVGA